MAVLRAAGMVVILSLFLVLLCHANGSARSERYVGSKVCAECHETEYSNYSKFSKKASSAQSVQTMASDLTSEELKECYACHTTGYGKPGGFVSYEQTPQMGNAGCEVCHGPGYDHADSGGDPELIKGKLDMNDCETCHNAARVASFNFKPLLYGGAH
jgi:mono/diheme cytochrome c family protein